MLSQTEATSVANLQKWRPAFPTHHAGPPRQRSPWPRHDTSAQTRFVAFELRLIHQRQAAWHANETAPVSRMGATDKTKARATDKNGMTDFCQEIPEIGSPPNVSETRIPVHRVLERCLGVIGDLAGDGL